MSHERAITIRRLSENDPRLAQGIDVSEDGQSVFRYINGELTTEPRKWHRTAWDAPDGSAPSQRGPRCSGGTWSSALLTARR